jgi:RNA polymerase sigma factor (sigma-70 family)
MEERENIPYDHPLALFIPLMESILLRWRRWVDGDFCEDLRQVARLACCRGLKTYDPQRGVLLTTHIYRCVFRDVRDAVRTYLRDHNNLLSLEEVNPDVSAAESESGQEMLGAEDWSGKIFLERLSDERICAAFQQLNQRDQDILALFYGGQWSDADIAARLKMTTVCVKKRRQRAVQQMRERLLPPPHGSVSSPATAEKEVTSKKLV